MRDEMPLCWEPCRVADDGAEGVGDGRGQHGAQHGLERMLPRLMCQQTRHVCEVDVEKPDNLREILRVVANGTPAFKQCEPLSEPCAFVVQTEPAPARAFQRRHGASGGVP